MNMKKVKVGVVGCGAISNAYFNGAKNFPILEMAAVADLDMDRARAKAAEHGVARACTVEELLGDPGIEIVLNLTVPQAHVPVALAALSAGKHTYAEKPLGVDRQGGREVLELAKKKGLRVGCAPDTVLGSGLQTARKLVDDGVIGRPVGFTALMLSPGHESWHPSPEFYYRAGGGPMFDMGPYYLTALLNLFGPVRRVMGMASIAIAERTITSEPKRGKKIAVETPDHVMGLMEFENGVSGALLTSFATKFKTYDEKQPITVYGSEGTIRVPDPNMFDGPVHVKTVGDADWREAPAAFATGYSRATGLADMAYAIRSGRKMRCDVSQAFVVLDLMQGFLDSSRNGSEFVTEIVYERPAAMPRDLAFGVLDE
ncbi:MAG TPA: Gfo/Idh/MocA family oxidoreductase [Tepidisphaeraceae bacterium]|jgi:predicted dehydrogenase|nr:Gfo/Idh/MocA family oxidoreductase [Tepidisphaeraceae bacterium]